MAKQSLSQEDLANSIDKTRKEVTILFTDIVDSSRYWDQFGDIKGRMMVDRHNRLVFPIIVKFHGRVVKTIGDGLMAAFKRPNDALNAAIGIQQILKKMRDVDRSFHAKVRIGLHTGKAIVEKNDVFGDAVNVAKRVEDFGSANEIYLSSATAEHLNEKKHAFHKKGDFIPKGKREPMTVYRCRWNEYKDFTRGLKVNSDFPLDARDKGDIVAFTLIATAVIAVLFITYGRFLLFDFAPSISLEMQLVLLNPVLAVTKLPFVLPFGVCLLLLFALILIWIRTIPYIILRLLKSVAGFGLGFALVYCMTVYFDVHFATKPGQEVYKSESEFVKLKYKHAKALMPDIFKQKNLHDFFERDVVVPVAANSVLASRLKVYVRRLPKDKKEQPMAVWQAKNLSSRSPKPWFFRLLDLCAICAGLMGFVSGFLNFHMDPR